MIKATGKQVYKCICQKCGSEWIPRYGIPKMCPACKSYKWNLEKAKKGAK